ncbi:MAG: hypothetical protein ACP5RZ_00760 [Thermoplasmata archaeon]
MYRKILTIFAILVILGSYFVGFLSNAGTPVFEIKTEWFNGNSSLLPVPGMTNVPLTINIKNLGPTLYNVTLGLNLSYPFTHGYIIKNNSEIEYNPTINIPEFSENGNISIFMLVNISSNARDGIYEEYVYINGSYSPTFPRDNITESFLLPVEGYINLLPVAMYPQMENGYIIPNMNPYPVNLILENNGNQPVTNVTLTLIPSYPLYGKNVTEKISAIPEFGYVNIKFLTNLYDDIKNGTYAEKIYYSYYNVRSYFIANLTISGSYSFSASGYFGLPDNMMNPAPGQKNVPFTVNIINTGTMVASWLNITVMPSYPLLGNNVNFSIPEMMPGQKIPLTFLVSISNSVNEGFYYFSVYINMKNLSWKINAEYLFLGNYSIVPLYGTLLTNSSLLPSPGMNNIPIIFYVSNNGNSPIENVTFTYTPSYPFIGVTQKITVPAIPPFEPIKLVFIVNISQNATNGYYAQKIDYTYAGIKNALIYSVLIPGYSKIKVSSYYLNPLYVYQNQTYNILRVFIVNEGPSPSFNTTIYSTSEMDILTGGLNLTMMPGMILNYTVVYDSPNTPGIYPLFIHIDKSIYEINITVYPKPNIKIMDNIPSISPGQSKVQITFEMENEGPGAIELAYVHVILPDIIQLHVSSNNPLGSLFINNLTIFNILPGQYFKIPYLVDVEDSAIPGKYTGELILFAYTNSTLRPLIYSFPFIVNVSTPFFSTNGNNATLNLSTLTIIILVIIIVALVGILIRQRKK